jgi:hypothetical protein
VAAFFVLMLLVVQIGMLAVARTTVSAAIDGTARRAAMAPDRIPQLEDGLLEELRSSIPGIEVLAIGVERRRNVVTVAVDLRWRPPGPDLVPIVMTVERARMVVVPP